MSPLTLTVPQVVVRIWGYVMKRILLSLFLVFSLHCAAYAAEINLYDQPRADAKAIGKVDPAVGIIPIFSSQDKMWMKVGDPRNGNVGWVKSADLSAKNGVNTSFTFTQKVVNDGRTVSSPILQVGPAPKLTPEQAELMRKLDVQRKAIQQSVQQNIQSIVNDLSQYYDAQMKLWNQEMAVPPVSPSAPAPAKK